MISKKMDLEPLQWLDEEIRKIKEVVKRKKSINKKA
jgi:hypothetical protein